VLDRQCREMRVVDKIGPVALFGSPEASSVTGQHLGASGGVAML
jgi:hypothetical protein